MRVAHRSSRSPEILARPSEAPGELRPEANMALDERRFADWLGASGHGDLAAAAVDQQDLGSMLDRLAASRTTMPSRCCAQLGVPAGSTFGAAARWLIWAVSSPGGPRCRSYRSAVYFVRGLVAGLDRFASGRDERAAAQVSQVAAMAMSLAYSQRGAAACIAELRSAADAATLRAARVRLLEHTVRDEELLERARLLLGDAAWHADVTR